jgi:hypothetical protein
MPINVPRYLHLDLAKHVMRNVSRLRLRAHTLKVEAAAWLKDGSRVCDHCPDEDEHVQNEVHTLLICQDHRVCELRKHFPFCLRLFLRNFQQPNTFCCNRSTTNLFMILSQVETSSYLQPYVYFTLADPAMPISPTYVAAGYPLCKQL